MGPFVSRIPPDAVQVLIAAEGAGTDSSTTPNVLVITALIGVMSMLAAYTKWSLNRVLAEKDAAVSAAAAANAAQIAAKDAEISRVWEEVERQRARGNDLRERLDTVTRLQVEQGIAAARDNAKALEAAVRTLQDIERDRARAEAREERRGRGSG
jgi:hypothetical protein